MTEDRTELHGHAGNNGQTDEQANEAILEMKRPCPKCGTLTPLRYLMTGRCPDCLIAEVRANAEATEAEFIRLRGVEAEYQNLLADRKVLLDSLSPDAILARDQHRAVMYRRLAVVLLEVVTWQRTPDNRESALPSLAWLRELAWEEWEPSPETEALVDSLASPKAEGSDGEYVP